MIRAPYSLSGDIWCPCDPVELPLYPPFLVFCPGLCSQSLPASLAQLHNFLVIIVYSVSPRMAWLTTTCCEIKPLPWLTPKGQITPTQRHFCGHTEACRSPLAWLCLCSQNLVCLLWKNSQQADPPRCNPSFNLSYEKGGYQNE